MIPRLQALGLGVLGVAAAFVSLPGCRSTDESPYLTCTPGTQTCAGSSIITCAEDGARYHAPVPCATTCTLTMTGPLCDGPGSGGSSSGSGGNGSGGSGSGSGGDAGESSGSGGSNASGGSGGGGDPPGNAPAVILLIDGSSSASDVEVPSGGTRWDAIVQSFGASGHPLEALQGQVAFGALRYTGAMDMCPDTTALAPALNNYGAVSSFVSAIVLAPATDTPTAEALTLAANSLSSHAGEKYVIVVTDGIPDTCANNDGICVADAVDAAQAAFTAGVTTILVTIGVDAFDATPTDFKQSFANAGSGAPVATPPPEQMTYNCANVMPTYADAGGSATFYEIDDANIVTELGPTLAEIVGDIAAQ